MKLYMNLVLAAYITSVIISAFRPLLFKHYKDYMLYTIIVSLFSMWIGSVVYQLYEGGPSKVLSGIKNSIKWENIKLSLLSEARFITKMFSLLFLPVSVSVPLSELKIISGAYFDNIINNVSYTPQKVISIILLIISGTFIGLGDYADKGRTTLSNYIFGGILMLISIILGGYMLIKFRNIAIEKGPGETMMIESTGSLILLAPLLLLIKHPPWRLSLILLLSTTLVFNIDILLKFIGLRGITIYQAIIFSAISTLISAILGAFMFGESLTTMKLVGLAVMISTIIYNGYRTESK